MEDKKKTLAAIAILIALFLFILVAVVMAITGKKVVSPLPEESVIKIIFISPTPAGSMPASPSAAVSSITPKPTLR